MQCWACGCFLDSSRYHEMEAVRVCFEREELARYFIQRSTPHCALSISWNMFHLHVRHASWYRLEKIITQTRKLFIDKRNKRTTASRNSSSIPSVYHSSIRTVHCSREKSPRAGINTTLIDHRTFTPQGRVPFNIASTAAIWLTTQALSCATPLAASLFVSSLLWSAPLPPLTRCLLLPPTAVRHKGFDVHRSMACLIFLCVQVE